MFFAHATILIVLCPKYELLAYVLEGGTVNGLASEKRLS
jgi:hypothetical protein